MEASDLPPINPNPPDGGAPLLCGLQSQATESTRGFRPAGSREWLLIAALEGRGRARAGGVERTLMPGDLLLIAPDTPQDYGALDERGAWVNVWAHFRARPPWSPWMAWPRLAPGTFLLATGDRWPLVEPELRRMVEDAARPARLASEMGLNALERVLLLCDEVNPLYRVRAVDARVRRALVLIGDRLASSLDVDTLARAAGLSRSRFNVLFAAETGLSPQAYVESARLARAAQMLALSSWPVGQVAEEVGFSSPYYFSTRFRRRYEMSPTAYRTRFGGSEG